MESPLMTSIDLGGKRVCRVMSNHEKKGRFTVENLNHVRCVLVGEHGGLLEKATSSTTRDDKGMACASLTLKLKEPSRKTDDEHYTMQVTETTIEESVRETQPEADDTQPHVIVCFVATGAETTIETLQHVRQLIISSTWSCPVLLVAFRSEPKTPASNDVIAQLKEISRLPTLFRCMEATSIGRNLVRHSLAVALLAARPMLASMREANELRIDDGRRKTSMEEVRQRLMTSLAEKQRKAKHHKTCRVQ